MRYQRESRLRLRRRRRRLLRRRRRAEYLPTNVRRVKLLWGRLIISPTETPARICFSRGKLTDWTELTDWTKLTGLN